MGFGSVHSVRIGAPLLLALWLSPAALSAGAPNTPVESIGPGGPLLSDRPGAEGLIRNGDESTVERIFVYLDGCPMLELVRPDSGTGAPQLLMIADPDAEGVCVPLLGAGAGVAPTLADGTAALAEEAGLHVRMLRESASTAALTDVERLLSPQGQTLIVDITSVDPELQTLMASGAAGPAGPVGPGATGAFIIPPLPGEPGYDEAAAAATATALAAVPSGSRFQRFGEVRSGFRGSRAARREANSNRSSVTQVSALEPWEPPRIAGRDGRASARDRALARQARDPGSRRAGVPPELGPVSAVPLPTAASALVLALAVLGALSVRRRRALAGLRRVTGGRGVAV